MEGVLEPVGAVTRAVRPEPADDRVFHLILALGADEGDDACGCDERAPDGVLIGELVGPGAVERAFGVEAGSGGDVLEHAGLGVIRLGGRISWSWRHEGPDD